MPGEKELLRAILDESDQQSFALDRSWRYAAFNHAHAAAMRVLHGAHVAVGDEYLAHLRDEDAVRSARGAVVRAFAGERFVADAAIHTEEGTLRFESRYVPVRDADGDVEFVVVHTREVTAQRRAEAAAESRSRALERLNEELIRETARLAEANSAIAQLARTDDLTGLANRREFLHALDREVSLVRRQGSRLALLGLDLDGFKSVNDTEGHAAGDEVLVAFATLLSGICRAEDLPARVGGDEFGILLPGVGAGAATGLAQRVVVAAHESIPLWRRRVTVSIGVAAWRPEDTAAALLHRADDALYAAKRSGGDACVGAGAERSRDGYAGLWRPARRRGAVI